MAIMNDRYKILMAFGIIALFMLQACFTRTSEASSTAQPLEEQASGIRLGFKNDPSSSMVVSWWSQIANTDSKVYYGFTESKLNFTATSTDVVAVPSGYIHNVELSNLQPDTRYYYKCGGISGNSTVFSFTTAPSPRSRGIHFAAYGDTRSDRLRRKIVADMIVNHSAMNHANDLELVLNTGDIVSNGTKQELFDHYSEDIEPLSSHIPIMYTAGNHEISGLRSHYPQQFVEPNNGNDGWFYSFNWGPVHFICSDSETHGFPILDMMDLNWLREDLRRANKDNTVLWIVVWFHQPPYVSFSHNSRKDLRDSWGVLFDKYNVDLILNGHCHAYQRNYPVSHDGTIYKAGDPHYVNPPYPLYIVSAAGAVNYEGKSQANLRGDSFQAKWHNSRYGPDGDYVFYPSNHFLNINASFNESTNKTKLLIDVIGLQNYTDNPTLKNYTVAKIDEVSITKDIPASWHEPINNVTYTGYSKNSTMFSVLVLVLTTGIVLMVNLLVIVSWRKAQKEKRRGFGVST